VRLADCGQRYPGDHDLPVQDYDKQSAEDIARKLKGFSQRELRTIDAYERKHENRATITDKIAKLTGDEPWSGYDELSVEAVAKAVGDSDQETAKKVREYERNHKDRSGVVEATGRRIDSN
jgi:hypothetical protein